eukprot:GEMP01028075.1.p1 GENE.GEMP01028075.1~~GEMP01028075.1.p1  ORF type:complete len:247 (-),score=21.80 GEMP01028075.1:1489-2229(-)
MDIERRYLFDLLLIGDFCVGKSSLLYRLLNDNFPEASNPTTLVTMYSTRSFEQEDGKVVKLKIRDTHGLERFGIEEFKSTFYRDAHGIIIVYDVTDRESFNNVKHWIEQIGRYFVPEQFLGSNSRLNNLLGEQFAHDRRLMRGENNFFVKDCFVSVGQYGSRFIGVYCRSAIFVTPTNAWIKGSSRYFTPFHVLEPAWSTQRMRIEHAAVRVLADFKPPRVIATANQILVSRISPVLYSDLVPSSK